MRQSQVIRLQVVAMSKDVYDEFRIVWSQSVCTFAISSTVTYLPGSRQPQYVLLVGPMPVLDPRKLFGQAISTFCPDQNWCYWQGEPLPMTGSSISMATVSQMAIGSCQCATASRVNLVVSKLAAYEQTATSNKALLNFRRNDDRKKRFGPPSHQLQHLLAGRIAGLTLDPGVTGCPTKAAILDQLNTGQ